MATGVAPLAAGGVPGGGLVGRPGGSVDELALLIGTDLEDEDAEPVPTVEDAVGCQAREELDLGVAGEFDLSRLALTL